MARTHHIHEDTSLLSRIDQFIFKIESALNLMGGLVIFLLVLLATTNVLGRWLFSLPISGYIDWVEQFMAFFAFLGLAYTQREGGHIRMDIAIKKLKGRALWTAEFVSIVFMLVITLILVKGSWLHFLRAYEIGDSSLDINLPTWPAKLVVPVSLSILALRLLLQLWSYGKAILRNEKEPIAVPLMKDEAEAIASEAEMILEMNKDQEQKNEK